VREPQIDYKPTRTPKPVFGSGKGTSGKMAADFDESLEEKPKLKREFGSLKGLLLTWLMILTHP
jgi:hypothetical protein